jgi:pimeloyl-ACP methyl ester carboxylesterase
MLTEKKVLFGKYSINTKSAGNSNKMIFFVHGNSQNAGSWDLQMMDESLSSRYKLVSFDLPGHGDSDWFSDYPALYSPKEFSKVLETVIKAYDAEAFILVGLSYGTNIIAEITEH